MDQRRLLTGLAAVVLLLLVTAGVYFLTRGTPPETGAVQIPTIKGPDGKEYVLLARGPHQPVYDDNGALDRIEYDRNGDGKPDQVAYHKGQRIPTLVENDDDFDGQPDHWVYYDAAGQLVKVGSSRRGGTKPDFWVYSGPDGKATKQDYDEDDDGRIDRTEMLTDGRVTRVEVDADRDGRIDRWQNWQAGRLVSEDLDTDGDGKPDRRLRYSSRGEVVGLEPLARR
jgi:hypothetical protein